MESINYMQTLDSLIQQYGYTSLDECIELHSNEIFTDEVWLWRSKADLEDELANINAQDFHWLLSSIIERIIEKGGYAVPAINGEGEALLAKLQHLPKRPFAEQLAQYCLDHPDFGENGYGVWFESNLSPQECEQGLAEYRERFSQGSA